MNHFGMLDVPERLVKVQINVAYFPGTVAMSRVAKASYFDFLTNCFISKLLFFANGGGTQIPLVSIAASLPQQIPAF